MGYSSIKTPSPYEEGEFTIPLEYFGTNTEPRHWRPKLSPLKVQEIEDNAFIYVVNKHIKKGAIYSSQYSLYYRFGDEDEYLEPIDNKHYGVYDKAVKYWTQLIKNPKIKIIFIPINIYRADVGRAHLNMLIIDKRRKCVEFFDPHGNEVDHKYSLIKMFEETCNFVPKTYTIRSYEMSCPPHGFQMFASAYGKYKPYAMGYCVYWTIFLLDLRLSNLSRELQDLQSEFLYNSLTLSNQDYNEMGERFRKFMVDYYHYWGNIYAKNVKSVNKKWQSL